MENRAIATTNNSVNLFAFTDIDRAWKFAEVLSRSEIIPDTFKNNAASCLIALDMANRMRRNPMEVMQALYIVHGKPSFSSSFLIGLINSCGLFERLRFEYVGTEGKDDRGCRAWTIEKATGEKLVGPLITMKMAREENWTTKNGSKWKTMPELMLQYRAASFFSRAYCPDLTGGVQSKEELADIQEDRGAAPESIQAQLLSEPQAPSPEEVKRLYNRYLKVLGSEEAAKDAMMKVVPGKASKDYTQEDLAALARDLDRREAEANEQSKEPPVDAEYAETAGEIVPEMARPQGPEHSGDATEKVKGAPEPEPEDRLRRWIGEQMELLGYRSDEAAVFYGESGGQGDLNSMNMAQLSKVRRAVEAELAKRDEEGR